MNVIPDAWLPAVPMKRVHGHWTAGGHEANETDRKAYHLLVEGDGKLVRGIPSIARSDAISRAHSTQNSAHSTRKALNAPQKNKTKPKKSTRPPTTGRGPRRGAAGN